MSTKLLQLRELQDIAKKKRLLNSNLLQSTIALQPLGGNIKNVSKTRAEQLITFVIKSQH